jgi:soluble lytic murein transglycosylase-like protein
MDYSGFAMDTIEAFRGFFNAPKQEQVAPAPTSDRHPTTALWGSLYQTESDQKKMDSFDQHQSIELPPEIESAVDTALTAFKGDKGITDQTKLRSQVIATIKHESLGGQYKRQVNGPAIGAAQVEPETAMDIAKTSGLIGKKAEAILGMSRQEFLNLDLESMENLLEKHEVNALFATAKYLQAAAAKGKLDALK